MVPVLTKDAAVLWRQLAGRHQPCEYPPGAVWSLNADTTKTNEPHNALSSTISREWALQPSGSRPLPANFTKTRATARRTMATGSRTCKAIVHERTSVVSLQNTADVPATLSTPSWAPPATCWPCPTPCTSAACTSWWMLSPTTWQVRRLLPTSRPSDDCNGREGNTCSTVLLTHSGL